MECGMGQDRRQDGILDGTVCGARGEGRGVGMDGVPVGD